MITKTEFKLTNWEKSIVWETLNNAVQKNQEQLGMTGDKLKKEILKIRNETLLKIAAIFAPGCSELTITKD